MIRSTRIALMRLATLLVAAAVLLASPQAKAQQTKLTIGSSVHSLFSLPLYIAETKGLFREEGLSVEIVNFQGGATATPALLGGSVELQSAATENLLKVVQQGQPIVAVMTVQSTFNAAIMVRKDLADKLGRKPTLADLKSLRVATLARGGMADMAMRYIVESQGLVPEKDVTLVPLAGYDRHLAALQAKDVDASMTVEPIQTFWSKGPAGMIYLLDILKGEGPALFQDMNWITLQGKKDWVEKNRDTVRKVVRAMVRAQTFISDPANLEQVTELAAKTFPNIPKPILQASIASELHTYTPRVTEEAIKKNNELLVKTGNLKAPIAYARIVDRSYADLWAQFGKK